MQGAPTAEKATALHLFYSVWELVTPWARFFGASGCFLPRGNVEGARPKR
jgi:hypothetical protein